MWEYFLQFFKKQMRNEFDKAEILFLRPYEVYND